MSNKIEDEEFNSTFESQSVNSALKDEKVALREDIEEDATDDGQIAMKEKEYKEYIDTHIENVRKAYDHIVKQYAEDELTANQLKQLETNLDKHDEDKNIPSIFDAYRRNHYPINDEEKEAAEEDYDIAWSYHKTHNPHHWEYWLNGAEEFAQDINKNEMKLAYFEMLCDWLSFGFREEDTSATGESTEFEVWYNDNKENIKIHPQLKEWLDNIINQIIEYIKENRDTIYNKDVEIEEESKKPLTKVENYSIIKEDTSNNKKEVGEKEMNKLQEDYKEFKKDNKFAFDFNVVVPLEMKQEDEFSTYEDNKGNDIEMDYDIDSLYESFEDAEKVIEKWFGNEDFLKEIFPNVSLGRVYPYLISLEEDKLEFNIGFSDIQDPVEEGNEINLNEAELKEQISDLVYAILDEVGFLNAKQYYDEYSGDTDEDGDPIYDIQYDDDISFSLNINGDIQIKENLTENKKLEEGGTSRIVQLAQQGYFATISAELSVLRYARVIMKDENIPDNETYDSLDKEKQIEILNYANKKYGKECKERNIEKDNEIRKDIREMNWGYTKLQGKYTYADGSVGYEKSYFVSVPVNERSESVDRFKNTIIGWGKHFDQESVIVGKEDKSNNKTAISHTYTKDDSSKLKGDEEQDSKGLTVSAGLYSCDTGEEWANFTGVTINDLGNNLSKLMQGTKESQSAKRSFEFFTESLDRIEMPWDGASQKVKNYLISGASSRFVRYRKEFEESKKEEV